VRSFEERSTTSSQKGAEAQACAFLELMVSGGAGGAGFGGGAGAERYGVGMDTNIVTASIKALISGVNRLGGVCAQIAVAEAA